jgi:hypothetical protein
VRSSSHGDLTTALKFEAMSNVWGQSTITRTVTCCAQTVQVIPDLCDALERVRLHNEVRTV